MKNYEEKSPTKLTLNHNENSEKAYSAKISIENVSQIYEEENKERIL